MLFATTFFYFTDGYDKSWNGGDTIVRLTDRLTDSPLSKGFAKLSTSESTTNPWQHDLDAKPLPSQPLPATLQQEDSGNGAWAAPAIPSKQTQAEFFHNDNSPSIEIPSVESPAWDEAGDTPEGSPVAENGNISGLPPPPPVYEEQHVWDDTEIYHSISENSTGTERQAQEETRQAESQWHEVVAPTGRLETGVIGRVTPDASSRTSEDAPALPPRRAAEDRPPVQPPRPYADATNRSPSPLVTPGTPESTVRTQNKETYEIKKIHWYDVNAPTNPRTSPILLQSANGPCPLLALVNALTLSTPAGLETALVETLRTREQLSLGLLLDAVIDELMSGRRGDTATELPDLGDLYTFLTTLHTGMNVNPCFVQGTPLLLNDNPRGSMSHLHPSEREASLPGTFEETREMRLYSTFSVPLLHGWLPPRGSTEYFALERSAKSYEDAQNLMFREEELEEKVHREGLSFQEQTTLEDISVIKAYLSSSATQLTEYGLSTISSSLAPGTVAILFRNDHFSTLYRHPESLQLLQLVTDMGYAGHDEVVWESLVDVSGENCEFFSGDFRLVGAGPSRANTPINDAGSGWTTVQGRRGPAPGLSQSSSRLGHTSANTNGYDTRNTDINLSSEQEDHDLALALQLQEEEDSRHRQEQAARRRESDLSQRFIERQSTNSSPSTPAPNRGQTGRSHGTNEIRPLVPPRRQQAQGQAQAADPEAGVDLPPPTYEQAATQSAYNPPPDHPAHPNASPNSSRADLSQGRGQRRASAYSETAGGQRTGLGSAQSVVGLVQGARNSRRSDGGQGMSAQQIEDRPKDCLLM